MNKKGREVRKKHHKKQKKLKIRRQLLAKGINIMEKPAWERHLYYLFGDLEELREHFAKRESGVQEGKTE